MFTMIDPPPTPRRDALRTNVARGSLLGLLGQGWHLLTVFVLYAFLARKLGPAGFGQWRVVVSVLVWFELFINSGLTQVATKSITESGADGRRRVVRASYLGQAGFAVAAFAALELLAGPIAVLLHQPALAPLLRISALDIPLYGAFMVASAVVLGEERFERQAVSWIVYATAKGLLIAGLVATGFSVQGALVGNALSSLVGFAAVFRPWERRHGEGPDLVALAATLVVATVPFLALSLSEGLGESVDLWLVSAAVPSAVLVGLYASAVVLAQVPTFLFQGLDRVLFPSVARAGAEQDARLAGHYAGQGIRLALLVNLLLVAIVAATGRQALTLVYGKAYVAAYVPLVLLMMAASGRTLRSVCSQVLMAEDRRRDALLVMLGTLATEIVLLVVLAPRYGLAGAAAAAAASALAGGAIAASLLARHVGTRPLLTLLRSAGAAAAVWAALAYLTPQAPAWLLAAYPLAAVAYVAVLAVLGEFGPDDIASLREAFGR
jgi:O-antigen/teichoic acid export membrane protein